MLLIRLIIFDPGQIAMRKKDKVFSFSGMRIRYPVYGYHKILQIIFMDKVKLTTWSCFKLL